MEFLYLFLILICCHFICDYPLQGDFIAKFKSRHIGGKYNPFWYHCLTAHSFIHAFPILIFTQNIALAALMIVSHWIIDFAKCENKLSLNQDQACHIFIILLICGIYYI